VAICHADDNVSDVWRLRRIARAVLWRSGTHGPIAIAARVEIASDFHSV
jgi:hypothetical protein